MLQYKFERSRVISSEKRLKGYEGEYGKHFDEERV